MRTWLEINLSNFRWNIKSLQKKIGNKKLIGVVKGNAYGMGAVRLTKELKKCGVDFFVVATVEEGIELRKENIDDNILILGGVFNEELKMAEKYNFQIALTSLDQLEYINKSKLNIKCHLKLETGMGRVGFNNFEIDQLMKYVEKNKMKNIIGVYSHLSVADEAGKENENYTKEQIRKFNDFQGMETIKYRHLLNSGGILKYCGQDNGNYVRAGIIQYGICGEKYIDGFKPVVSLKSRILFLKILMEDSDISYGRTAHLKKGDMVATISAGYADGFKRSISNKGFVFIDGIKCPVTGRVCMDMFMVKIPNNLANRVKVGDEVILYGENILEVAKLCNTISYEIFTGISRRVKRIYVE
ncbi:alanine racemase [Fusobacterium sp. MFO224]|uniref:alanine racemase n=1 Tax=Fusobacterium sp. MFO224 TaxID=3378070 RepID=UPI0038540160